MRWYYHDGQKQIGPIDETEMIKLVESGVVRSATQVWKEGTPSWSQVASSELKQHLPPEPPPLVQMSPPPMHPGIPAPGLV